MKLRTLTILLLLQVTAGSHKATESLQTGDLLFFADTTGMGAAVKESTGQYTHVALVEEVGDTIWIIDATQRFGVSRRMLEDSGNGNPGYDAYRFVQPFDTTAVVSRAKSCIGQPYDQAFLPDNGALYCSELIYECFLDSLGNHLFEAHPMNWRTADGSMPSYWIAHFDSLGQPIPEGVLGTNPSGLARSSNLKRVHLSGNRSHLPAH